MVPEDATPQIRMSDAERERVVDHLRSALNEGRISLGEFEERSAQVYAAKFASDVSAVTADLPSLPAPLGRPGPVGRPQGLTTPTAGRRTRWAVQIMGGQDRRGNWDVGDELRSVTIMAGQELDLTEVAAEVVNITCFTLMGGTEIVVPDGAKVEVSGFMLFGGSSNNANTPGDSTMVVRVRAFGAMGGCEVRNLSKRQRKKRQLPPG